VGRRHKANVLNRLRSEAEKIRALVSSESLDFLSQIDLGSPERLPTQYEAATIVAIAYKTKQLPSEQKLREDLKKMSSLYGAAVARKRVKFSEDPDSWEAGLPGRDVVERVRENKLRWKLNFSKENAKPGGDVFFPIKAGIRRVSRRHVAVLESLRSLLKQHHWSTSNPHPFDLEARHANGRCFLIEVKVVREDDIASAAREAIGQ
jgi:hypothetical protein